ncbi:hypothetical protein QTP88_018513 [Uroleucon formosanum]
MNDCLSALTFPPRWKRARLVLIRKGADKPREAPSSYRPICMLDSTGKLLERLLLQRLERHLDEHGGTRRAANQFGFRKGIGTDSAVNSVLSTAAQAASTPGKKSLCVLVTLDVKNAFNSLRWPVIDAALRRLRTPEYLVEMLRSWLSDRTLLTGADRTPRPVTCGVPQGSVLGPALWNVAYSSLLKMKTPPGVQLIGFADDLAVVGTAVTGQLLEDLVNPVLRNIDERMTSHGLELAHHKTEAVILSRRRAYVPPRLSIAGHPITLYDRIRYLGVVLDRNLTFAAHVDTVAKKASRTAAALARLMPNIGGPSEWKRKLLGSVVDSQLLYAAPAWIDKVAAVARTRANLIRPQRTVALRTIRAYRTVSDEAALQQQQQQRQQRQQQQQQQQRQQQQQQQPKQQQRQASWSEVVKRRKKPPTPPSPSPPTRPPTAANGKLAMLRQRAPKTAAVTIDRPAEGASLAAVMKKVAGTINLGALGVRVLTSRRTRAGGILLEVEGEEKAALLEGKIREVAGDTARVRRPQRKTPVLLLNIPEWAEAEDVVSGLAGAGIVVAAKSVSLRSNGGKRGDLDRVARVDLPFRDAIALAVAKAVEVGWTRCRVKLLEKRQSTCFRCQQKGHHAAECRSEAKPRSCFGCGSSDHLARECTRKGKQRSSGGAAGAAGAAAAGEGAKERSQAEGPSRSAGRPASPPSGASGPSS